MADENNNFQEVISLQIDTGGFAKDLQAVEQMWNSTLAKMSESAQSAGIDPAQVINVKPLQDDFVELAAQVSQLNFVMQENFSSMSSAVNSELASIDAAVTRTEAKIENLNKTKSRGAGSSQLPVVDREDIPAPSPAGQKAGGFFSDIGEGFTSGKKSMGEMIGMLAQFQVMWGAASLAVNGVLAAVNLIPNAIKEGIKYTAEFQAQATDLQGVLAGNIQFSKDFATNMRMAGESASFAVKGLQDNAAKFNLDPKQLQNSFKATVDAGGASMVKDIGGLVQLTTEFGVAMKAAGKSVEGTRALVSEIPKLLEGTETAQSKLLLTLGLTVPQWEAIRQQAMQHKDLLEQLSPALSPYLAAMQLAQDKHEVLNKELGLAKDRVESAFAAPVLKEWDSQLERGLSWLKQNQNEVELFGNSVGGLIAEVMQLGEAFVGLGGKGHPVLAFFADIFSSLTVMIEGFKIGLETIGVTFEKLYEAGKHPLDTAGWKKAFADIKAYADSADRDLQAKAATMGAAVRTMQGDDSSKATDATTGGVNHSTAGAKPPRPVDQGKQQLEALRQNFADQLEAIKSNSALLVEAEDESQAKRTESVATATANRKAIRDEELNQVQTLVETLRQQYGKVPGADKALDGMGRTLDELKSSASKQNTSGEDQLSKMKLSMQSEVNKALEAAAQEHSVKMLAIDREALKNGQITHLEAAQNEIKLQADAFAQKREALTSHLSDAGQNEQAKQAAQLSLQKLDVQFKDAAKGWGQKTSDATDSDTAASFKSQLDVLKQREEDEKTKTATSNVGAGPSQIATNNQRLVQTLRDINTAQQAATRSYLAWVEAHNGNDQKLIQSLRDQLGASKDQGQKLGNEDVDDFNAKHWTQKTVDPDTGQSKDAGWGTQLKSDADKLATVFSTLASTTNGIIAAMKQGNVWKGAGAGASGIGAGLQEAGKDGSGLNSLMKSLGASTSALPGIGAAVGLAGSLFSAIGGLFQQNAQEIATNVQKAFTKILDQFNNQSIDFTKAMSDLNTERQNAIQQLSGVKGGQGYLTQILDSIKQTQDQMQFAATQAQNAFQQQTVVMSQSSQAGQQWLSTWMSIENQIKQYLQQGGSTSTAAKYQNEMLKNQSIQLQDQYDSGMQKAIADNIQLNSLTMQRQQLMLSIQQLQQSTADSIERREAPAAGLAAQQTRLQLQSMEAQLTQTNAQISLQQTQVAAENKMFGLTTDINALNAENATLQMRSVNEQLAGYQEMLKILTSIQKLSANPQTGYFNGTQPFSGLPTGVPGFGATPAQSIKVEGGLNVYVTGTYSDAKSIAYGVSSELARRYGY